MLLTSITVQVDINGNVARGSLNFYDRKSGTSLSTNITEEQGKELDSVFAGWRLAAIDTAEAALKEGRARVLALELDAKVKE